MRHFRAFVLIGAAAIASTATSAAEPPGGGRPNIVFVMADDLGYGDPRCYNADSKIPTPHIDRLAKEGMRFTDAHSPSAVCTPTRYGVLTGRYCWRTRLMSGVLWGYSPALIDTKRLTVASLLKRHGYRTGAVGKWHLGLGTQKKADYSKPFKPSPVDYGFDYFFGIPASLDMDPYVWIENDRVLEQPSETIKKQRNPRGVFWRGGRIAPGFKLIDVLPRSTDKAVAFIQRQAIASPGKPFLLYLPFSAPHTPWLPTAGFKGYTKAGLYGDFTAQVDASLGRVLKVLDETKLAANTLVIFTSDNGAHWTPQDKKLYPHRANGLLRGQKADIWEGGHRVPFVVRWPGRVKPGSACNETICHTDLLATCAAVVGAKLPAGAGEDSFSILTLLSGGKGTRAATVHHSANGTFAIRQGPWKLILGRGSGGFSRPRKITPRPGEPTGQLYNLDEDLAETQNLYAKRPEIVKRLTAQLNRIRQAGRSR